MQQTQNYLKLLLFIMNRDGKSLLVSQACNMLAGKAESLLCESPKETFWAGFLPEYAESFQRHVLQKPSELGTSPGLVEENRSPQAVLRPVHSSLYTHDYNKYN